MNELGVGQGYGPWEARARVLLDISAAQNAAPKRCSGWIGRLDDDIPETLELVVAALRPMIRIRDLMNRPGEASLDDELLGDLADALTEANADG